MQSLEGRIVLVSGAARGLGRELTRQLSLSRASLVLVDIDADGLAEAADLARAAGAISVDTHTCDIAELDQVDALAAALEQGAGRVDVLVNNAGIFTDDEIERRDPERRRTAFLVNALGPIQMTNALLPLLRHSDPAAHVLNVISASGFSDTESADNRRWSTYGATKAALAGYNTTLTRQLAPDGIRVSGVFPGGFESDLYENAGTAEEQHDAFWMMRTEDVAEIIVFVLTRPADVNIERLLVTKLVG